MSQRLLADSPESRKVCVMQTTNNLFHHVQDMNPRKILMDAQILDATGYQAKIHTTKNPAVQASKKVPGELWVNPGIKSPRLTKAEYIILKAIGDTPIHEDLPDVIVRFRSRIRAKLWNALDYIRRNK